VSLFEASRDLLAKQRRIDAELARFRRDHRPEVSPLPRQVADVVRYIHDHLFDPGLSVASAKSRCRIRNNNISLLFRRTVGVGVREYIEQLRLGAARRLLGQPDLEVYLIGMAVGYDHPETFTRAFQRRYRCTPGDHRLARAHRPPST